MIPPSLNDFGKAARDLLTKSFHFGHVKFETRSVVNPTLNFNIGGTSHIDSGKISSFLESKYKVPERGLTFTEKWTSENIMHLAVSIEDQILNGLKVDFETGYEPYTQKKQAKVKATYTRDYLNTGFDVEFDQGGPTATASCALGYNGYLAGGLIGCELARGKLHKTQFAFGYQNEDLSINGSLINGGEIQVLLHHRLTDNLEMGAQINAVRQLNVVRMAGALKYSLSDDSFIKTSLNNQSQLGVAYSLLLRRGVRATVCALVDLKRFTQPNMHIFGLAMEFDVATSR